MKPRIYRNTSGSWTCEIPWDKGPEESCFTREYFEWVVCTWGFTPTEAYEKWHEVVEDLCKRTKQEAQ